jgi:hypothetical protein
MATSLAFKKGATRRQRRGGHKVSPTISGYFTKQVMSLRCRTQMLPIGILAVQPRLGSRQHRLAKI